jgi:lipoprotein-anchoring transpeptidase ErfK/SrfK
VAVLTLAATAGCRTSEEASANPAAPRASVAAENRAKPLKATITPSDKAKDVITATDITVRANGAIRELTVTNGGKPVSGAFTEDGGVWRPAAQLDYSSTYVVKVVAATDGGQPTTLSSTFTTMPKPSRISGASLYFADGDTVGIGMPLVVEFTYPVPPSARAAIEQRLMVTTAPHVEGVWHWFSGSEAHYRPEKYWAPGTKITLRAGVGGLPMGNGMYGKRDRIAHITVGRAMVSKVDANTHEMKVYQDGKLIRTMPASLGKRSTPTSSGIMVAMEKHDMVIMDSSTYGVPIDSPAGYRVKVYDAVRFTWGGEFTHGAPWSVGDQGRRNVSHGCVNLSPSNARWFTGLTLRGDVIEVDNTGRAVKPEDGWTDWNIPWQSYLTGSSLR